MDSSYLGEFLTKQFPVSVLLLSVVFGCFKLFNNALKDQTAKSKEALESQAARFNQAVEEERSRLNEFWKERDIKNDLIMNRVAEQLTQVAEHQKATNKILVYQSINSPQMFKKSRSEKMNDILEILKVGDKKNDN